MNLPSRTAELIRHERALVALWLAADDLVQPSSNLIGSGLGAGARPGRPPRSPPEDRCAAVWLAACHRRATASRLDFHLFPARTIRLSCSGPSRSIAQWRESCPPPTTGGSPDPRSITPTSRYAILSRFGFLSLLVALLERQRRHAIGRLETINKQLQNALSEIKTLHGLLPICSTVSR